MAPASTYVVRDPSKRPFDRETWPFAGPALVEEFISGQELTVTVLGDRALTVTEIIPAKNFYDFTAKYAPGGSEHVIPARISPAAFAQCLEQAVMVHTALGCRGISRSDFILDNRSGEPVFLEVNTQPGMTPRRLLPNRRATSASPSPLWFARSSKLPRPIEAGMELSLPKTRFERTGDAIRPRLHVRRCPRSGRSGARPAHPFRAKHEDATHYNRRRISQGSASGALR